MSPLALRTGNVEIVDIRANDVKFSLVKEIHKGIDPPPGAKRSMPTILLYDALGLKLFEEITYLDEYYLTNAEIEVLERNAKRIVEWIPKNAQLLELGSGNLRKIEILLRELERVGKRVDYYALDLSLSELQRTFANVSTEDFTCVSFHGLHGTYDDALEWLARPENRKQPTVVLSMGSSLGNFGPSEATGFLSRFAKLLSPPDLMLIGLDACGDQSKIYSAYNDAAGVTQQFYENGLSHANAVLGYEAFKPVDWKVVTEYDSVEGRHQAFYVPTRDVTINDVSLKRGEKLIFEEAFKYDSQKREKLWHSAALIESAEFGNTSDDYHIHLLSPAALSLPDSPSKYAAHSIPGPEEFQSLWTAWDISTKAMISKQELLSKPIKLRNALIFYLGHIPTFSDIHITRALGGKPTHPRSYQLIFERGIDPDVDDPTKCHSHSEIPDEWPLLCEIVNYQERVRTRIRSILEKYAVSENRCLAEALWIGFEHELLHLETFLYMLIQSEKILSPPGIPVPNFKQMFDDAREHRKPNEWFTIPEQLLSVGLDDDGKSIPKTSFGWDNEKPKRQISVGAFEAQARPVTNGEYARYMQANPGCQLPASWVSANPAAERPVLHTNIASDSQIANEFMSNLAVRTVFGPVSLELAQDWPVIASYDELALYAKWMNCRIPTYEEAKSIYAYSARLKEAKRDGQLNGNGLHEVNGENGNLSSNSVLKADSSPPSTPPNRPVQPLSTTALDVFVDLADCNVGFKHWHPTPVIQNGDRLAGHAEMGGVWEWTSTPLSPHDGFEAMEIYPGYTSDFFDGKHNVILGGSWATHPRVSGRTTFVNWYQRNYPYAWAGARLVRDI